jgi:2-oxoisovalerate dehydrogenase E1 component
MPNYYSDMRPEFAPREINCGTIPCYRYQANLKIELADGKLDKLAALDLLEDMLTVRELEEMIVKLRSGAYQPISDFNYRGPTHVSVGQEATSVGACAGIAAADYITSTHRGHGDSVARGCAVLRGMTDDELRKRVPASTAKDRQGLLEDALEDHVYRSIAELFGKEAGYCKGRGGGMHIADYSLGHLGANAIVGGGVPIATGAAMGARYLENGSAVLCFAGDGAYANGVVLESLNWAAQKQWTNQLAGEKSFGLPIIFFITNNHFGMTGRTDEETSGVRDLARRAAGFAGNNMHAEVVCGMDALAVRDAVTRAAKLCREGQGPVLIEADTYRYYGHSLSDPRNEYRTREEEAAWKEVDPVETFKQQLLDAGVADQSALAAVEQRVVDRNARAAVRAAAAPEPKAEDVLKYMYTDSRVDEVPAEFASCKIVKALPEIKRGENGELTYRDAVKEALIEEMQRDSRVIFYGEDVSDYGGAFKASKGLLEAFGRDRVFNTPISEAAICGTAVGAAMLGLRPVAELMYMDFTLMASDQISNQAAKWHYMSGGQTEVPLVYRASVGGGKGYGGQHSQTLESIFCHIPGLYVVYPATPYDAKGMLKTAIRDNNPVLFVESQLLYGVKGIVPAEDYLVPFGVADVKRSGEDITLVTWGPAVATCLDAAEKLAEDGKSAEVIDLRSLVPLDIETVLSSVRKTGRCVVVSQAVHIGSYTAEIASTVQSEAFDYLDAPVGRVGAKNGIAPQSHVLEAAFLPNTEDVLAAARAIL